MKSLRVSALMLVLGAFSICSIPAHAQQELDPDHFDRPGASSTHVRGSKTQSHRVATAAQPGGSKKLFSAPSHRAHHRQNARPTSGSNDIVGD